MSNSIPDNLSWRRYTFSIYALYVYWVTRDPHGDERPLLPESTALYYHEHITLPAGITLKDGYGIFTTNGELRWKNRNFFILPLAVVRPAEDNR